MLQHCTTGREDAGPVTMHFCPASIGWDTKTVNSVSAKSFLGALGPLVGHLDLWFLQQALFPKPRACGNMAPSIGVRSSIGSPTTSPTILKLGRWAECSLSWELRDKATLGRIFFFFQLLGAPTGLSLGFLGVLDLCLVGSSIVHPSLPFWSQHSVGHTYRKTRRQNGAEDKLNRPPPRVRTCPTAKV